MKMEGYNFVFLDNQYWNESAFNHIYIVTMEKPEDIKKFKRAYRKMMNRYWNDEICGDFYEQLDDELRKYNMSITETDKVETYWSIMK